LREEIAKRDRIALPYFFHVNRAVIHLGVLFGGG
jgi:hypothetical protein